MAIHVLGLRLSVSYGALEVSSSARRWTLSVLTKLQNASASFLAIFAIIHLSSPLMGLLHLNSDLNDRVDAVSRWMLLGRVAYQSSVGEPMLWATLITHVASGFMKRVVKLFTIVANSVSRHDPYLIPDDVGDAEEGKPDENTSEGSSESSHEPLKTDKSGHVRPRMIVSQISGYAVSIFLLHHIWINRLLPSSARPPISSLSPSELDYSFVSHTVSHPIRAVRWISSAAYVGLIGAFATHLTFTLPILRQHLPAFLTWKKGTKTSKGVKKSSKLGQAIPLAAILLASLMTIVPTRSDQLAISGSLKQRYDAVLQTAFPTKFFF